jgi:hypothetical protein
MLAALAVVALPPSAQALTPLMPERDIALLEEAKAACVAPNFPRFLRAFAGSQIVRNAYTAEEVRFAETRIDANGRERTTARTVLRLAFSGFPLRFENGRYVLAPGVADGRAFGRLEEARVSFGTPRKVFGRTLVRWGADRGSLSAAGHESARLHGYTGAFVFTGDGACWRLTQVRAIYRP